MKSFSKSTRRFNNYSTFFLPSLLLVLLGGLPLQAQQNVGMDPGLNNALAEQTRRGVRFSTGSVNGGIPYHLVAVTEQGDLQDSRPFPIIDSGNNGKARYFGQSANNVSPFFFEWSNSLGRRTAVLEVDSLTRPYFYRNDPAIVGTPSPNLRDRPRTIYLDLPGNYRDGNLPQLKNSLDEHVHLAFFERDRANSGQRIPTLRGINYNARLRAGSTQRRNPSQPNNGSRMVASIHWAEDANGDGREEVYLIELNIGGQSNLGSWQSDRFCVKDNNSHAHLISGQYLILGAAAVLPEQALPLQGGRITDLNIPWGDVLDRMRSLGRGTPCHLKATMNHKPNTIALGVAMETRGAVSQRLEISGVTISVGGAAAIAPAQPQTQQPVAQNPVNNNPAAQNSGQGCQSAQGLTSGIYRVGERPIYVNDANREGGGSAFCRLSQSGMSSSEFNSAPLLCSFPADRRDDGFCSGVSDDAQPQVQAEPEPQPEPQPEPEPEPQPEPQVQPEPAAASQPAEVCYASDMLFHGVYQVSGQPIYTNDPDGQNGSPAFCRLSLSFYTSQELALAPNLCTFPQNRRDDGYCEGHGEEVQPEPQPEPQPAPQVVSEPVSQPVSQPEGQTSQSVATNCASPESMGAGVYMVSGVPIYMNDRVRDNDSPAFCRLNPATMSGAELSSAPALCGFPRNRRDDGSC